MEFEAVIGLEVHAQLLTQSKIYCACSTQFGSPSNSNTCPVCLGLPGALPVVNREAVAMALKVGIALGCRIDRASNFARKNYFYPDLPKGYQISQYEQPLAVSGRITLWSGRRLSGGNITDYRKKSFGILRVHLEDDAGKSVHMPGVGTYVNLNRTGVPLIEIVSEADFRSSQEAYDYLDHLKRVFLYLGVCDGNMEQGSLRCDANVSIRPAGRKSLGTKTEIKNLNSFRFLQKALDYEIQRQIQVVKRGGLVEQETRLWSEEGQRTVVMRSKEEAHDYRYFPEPDLLPILVSEEWLEQLRSEIPELPRERQEQFVDQYGLSIEEALLLTQTAAFADYFEVVVKVFGKPRPVLNWMMGDLTRSLKLDNREVDDCPIDPRSLGRLIQLIDHGVISGKMGKQVFKKMYQTGEDPVAIVSEKGLEQISDQAQLESIITQVLVANPKKVETYRVGKHGLLGFFVGQVMRETRGKANPELVNQMLREKLKSG